MNPTLTGYRFRNRYNPADIIFVTAKTLGDARKRLARMVTQPTNYVYLATLKETTVTQPIRYRFRHDRGSFRDIYIDAAHAAEAWAKFKLDHPSRIIRDWQISYADSNAPTPQGSNVILSLSDDGKTLTRTWPDGRTETMPINPELWRAPLPTVPGFYVSTARGEGESAWTLKSSGAWYFAGTKKGEAIVPLDLTLVHAFPTN